MYWYHTNLIALVSTMSAVTRSIASDRRNPVRTENRFRLSRL